MEPGLQSLSGRPRRRVALLIETSNAYSRELLRGIRAWLREHADWAIHLTEQGRGDVPPPWLRHWEGDGVIARIETRAIERAVRACGVPVVNVSAAGLAAEFPQVIAHSREVARRAAEHLLERGFRQFAFCGDGRFAWSARHGTNFAGRLAEAGYPCLQFDSRAADFGNWERERRKLSTWLRGLPRPIGIMACYDIRGQQLLEVCRELDLVVPEEVAVIGQHNDEVLCELCDPPLSSVIPNAQLAGYQAAGLLDRLMNGSRAEPLLIEVEPVGVATRESTDVVAVKDRQLSAAVRFIREHATEGIGVEEVLRAVPMSRTLLERKFRVHLGRSPYEHIQRARLDRVKELLTRTDLSLAEIAERTGFSQPEYLSAVFKKSVGLPPRQFRRNRQVPAITHPPMRLPPG